MPQTLGQLHEKLTSGICFRDLSAEEKDEVAKKMTEPGLIYAIREICKAQSKVDCFIFNLLAIYHFHYAPKNEATQGYYTDSIKTLFSNYVSCLTGNQQNLTKFKNDIEKEYSRAQNDEKKAIKFILNNIQQLQDDIKNQINNLNATDPMSLSSNEKNNNKDIFDKYTANLEHGWQLKEYKISGINNDYSNLEKRAKDDYLFSIIASSSKEIESQIEYFNSQEQKTMLNIIEDVENLVATIKSILGEKIQNFLEDFPFIEEISKNNLTNLNKLKQSFVTKFENDYSRNPKSNKNDNRFFGANELESIFQYCKNLALQKLVEKQETRMEKTKR